MKLNKLIAILAVVAATPAYGFGSDGDAATGRHLTERAYTNPPIGYVQFCQTHSDDCRETGRTLARPELTAAAWQDLVGVNAEVNAQVRPITDAELFGVPELWTYPANQGDCEDYVLLKRKRLIERGWPANAVLITVVRDENGDGHAVLTVASSAGDLVLDNQVAEIRFWNDTPYRYLKRQSRTDATRWVSLDDYRALDRLPMATAAK